MLHIIISSTKLKNFKFVLDNSVTLCYYIKVA